MTDGNKVSEEVCTLIDWLEGELTEERTDELIGFLAAKLPFPANDVAKVVLDELFPEHLISALRSVAKCEGAITGGAVQTTDSSPTAGPLT